MRKSKSNNLVKFSVNLRAYPLEAVYQAAYTLLDRVYVFLDAAAPNKIQVFLKGKKNFSQKQLGAVKEEFFDELLNSALRLEVAKRNKKIREAIIGQALLSAMEKEEPSSLEDPLGIAVPWEEKYGKKK